MSRLPKPRKKKTVSVDKALLEWVGIQVAKGKFKNYSHAVEIALEKLRGSEENS
jgi:Arc/MetJ-type ribon-helix-helix transcriptional regulator